MPLTKNEQKTFEEMFCKIQNTYPNFKFINKIADVIFEMTGNVNLRMKLFMIAQKLV